MSVVTDNALNEILEEPKPTPADETDTGLVKLGNVSETKGGIVGYFFDPGSGFSFIL
jgi:hypothetical protein